MQHCQFSSRLPNSNINGDVMATLRLVFRVSKIQQYSENFVQDLLSAGLSSSMHGKPLQVPEFGQIDAVILLGSKAVTRRLCVTRVFTFIRSDGDVTCHSSFFVGASGKSFYAIGDSMIGKLHTFVLQI